MDKKADTKLEPVAMATCGSGEGKEQTEVLLSPDSHAATSANSGEHRHLHHRRGRRRNRRKSSLIGERPEGAVFEGVTDGDFDETNEFDGSSSEESDHDRSFRVIRPVYTQQQFDEKHGGRLVRRPLLSRLREQMRRLIRPADAAATPGGEGGDGQSGAAAKVRRRAVKMLPFIGILRQYNVKEWLLADFISGLTVGIMHIPQGMAYAFLAELPPYLGLYTSFFPSLIYFFFGTSRQVSMGTLAIISLLMGGLVSKNFPSLPDGSIAGDGFNATSSLLAEGSFDLNATEAPQNVASQQFPWNSDPVTKNRVALACATCFCVGILQFVMGILRLGFLTRYLSDPLISGFTMGVAVHVFSSQIKYVLGIKTPGRSGVFSLPLHYIDLIRNIAKTNFVTVGIAAVSIIILYVTKEYINPRVKKRIKAPLPTELLIVTLGTILSHFLNLKKNHNVNIVGHIPTGIPPPEIPDFSILKASMAVEIVTVAIIAFSVCVSLAKIFGKKHNYEVAPSQELIAYGVCNTVGAFFHCWPAGTSLSRSAVQDSMGGKTQVAALFSSTLLLLVLLFIGKYFESVPNCCLSAIIIVAIKGMLEQVKEAPVLWRLSPYDFWTWIVTCFGVVFLAVDYGLIIGLAFSIFTIIVRTQSPTSSMLGRIPDTDLYKNLIAYDDIEEVHGIRIFRFEGSIYFACADNFRESLYHKSGVNPRKLQQLRRKLADKYLKIAVKKQLGNHEELKRSFDKMTEFEKTEALKEFGLQWRSVPVHHIILDASTWGYMDYVGVRALNQTIQDFKEVGITVFLANPKCGIRACLQRSDFYEKNDPEMIYVSVHDAVLAAQFEHRTALNKETLSAAAAAADAADAAATNSEPTVLNAKTGEPGVVIVDGAPSASGDGDILIDLPLKSARGSSEVMA